ncbi:putative ABC transporter permease [Clostridium frigidicarnis]|uniref:Putative ABC-transporter type IV n=1 Tax=Clostridium frigidicarnis TaxID=84698 RepID=A0A1I0ZSN3_9CLOT|nr:putative ABC transporter permease [Clostridium frigidicarnis]SFB28577.1 Putative ABC-transporter type IV [Clostridium frigidicarnis]
MLNKEFILYFTFNFFLYGFIGWIIENLYSYHIKGHFQKDGFLNNPFKPMYGIAMSFIIAISDITNQNTYSLILICFIIPTLVEYTTGVIMRKNFHKDYWDYSKLKHNFQGIVCIKFSIYWTFLTFIGVRYLQTHIVNNFYLPIKSLWLIVCPILLLALIIDDIFTIRTFKGKENNLSFKMLRLRKR